MRSKKRTVVILIVVIVMLLGFTGSLLVYRNKLSSENVINDSDVYTAVDKELYEKIVNDKFKNASLEERKEIASSILNKLENENKILKGSIKFNEEYNCYFFLYSNGAEGSIMLGNFSSSEENDGGLWDAKKYISDNIDTAYKPSNNIDNSLNNNANVYINTTLSNNNLIYKITIDQKKTALIIDEGSTDAKYKYLRNVYENYKEIWSSNGLETTIKSNITVEEFKTILNGYDFVDINAHGYIDYDGNPTVYLQENQSFVDSVFNGVKYSEDRKFGRVGTTYGEHGGNFYLTSHFFADYYKYKLSDTIVWLSCCKGYSNDTLVSTFANECGVKSVIAATDNVWIDYDTDMTDIFVHKLLLGHTVDNALKEAKLQFGKDGIDFAISKGWSLNKAPAEFKNYNGGNETLVELISTNGTLSGTVTDENGNPIKGAEIVINNVRGMSYGITATTNENGEYTLECPQDSYKISVKADGYKIFETDDFVSVNYNEETIFDIILESIEIETTTTTVEPTTPNTNYDVEVISKPLTKNDIIFGTGNITVEEPHCNYPTFRSSNPELQEFLQNNITQDILNELNHNTSNATATKQITYTPYGDFEFAKVFDHYLQIYQYFTKSWNGGQGEDFTLTYLVDLKKQQVLSLYDLFSDDKETVKNELIRLLQEKYQSYDRWNPGSFSDNKDVLLPYYNKIGAYTVEALGGLPFKITEDDITFIFNQGEVTPDGSSWGQTILTIPWNEIHLNCIFGAMTSSEEELKNIMSSYGNICAWEYADYDGNGTKEAFAIVGTNSMPDYYISDSIQGVYFISAKGEVKELGKTSNGLMCSIERCTEYAGKKFFSYNATAGGSGSQTYLFSVKNGNGYELSISGTIVDFYSKNNKCYATVSEFLPDGGHVWPEYELIYDESLQEFSLPNNQTNSENQIASTTEQSENVSVSDNQILKAVNKYLAENQSHLGVWLSDGNPYCPAEYMRSSDKKWSCPINLSWESYSGNEMAGAYPHFAYVDKGTLKCTLTANYETVVEFDLSDYIK